MSALLRQSMKGASLDAKPPNFGARSRNESIPDFVQPNEFSRNLKIFSNASKAITSGQGDLLKMFIKKHPAVCGIRHEVEREAKVKVNKETGEKVVEEATTVNMTLIEIAAETGRDSEDMCIALLEGMAKGKELLDDLCVMYEGEKCGIGVMARVNMRRCLECVVARATEEGAKGAIGMEEFVATLKALKDSAGNSLLWIASAQGANKVISYLLEIGFDVDERGSEESSPLHVSAYRGGPIDVQPCKILVENGAEIEALDGNKMTPFFLAAKAGNVPMLELLHSKGADVNPKAMNGAEAIYAAAQKGNLEVVDCLLGMGCDPNCLGCGVPPLHVACMFGNLAVVKRLLQAPTIDLDIEGGPQKSSAVGICSQTGEEECLKLLIQKGANVNKKGVTGATPLHLGAWFGKKGCVNMLLEAGANADEVDENGKRAHEYAAEGSKHGNPDSKKVEKLLRERLGLKVKGKKKKGDKVKKAAAAGAGAEDKKKKDASKLERMG